MSDDIFELNEKIALMKYADILYLPHHQSSSHPPMSMLNRAAQFGSFAAVAGHEEALAEYARHTDQQEELEEDQREYLDRALLELRMRQTENPLVRIKYFAPDSQKEGGTYEECIMHVVKIDEDNETIELETGEKIPLSRILELELCSKG